MHYHTASSNMTYLTFRLAGQNYGLEITRVREIIGCPTISKLPQMPDSVRGVINLRGKVIPVTDLRRRFELPETEITDRSCIIVVETTGEEIDTLAGLLVDSVSEVLRFPERTIETVPRFGGMNAECTGFMNGIANAKEGVHILLNVGKVISAETPLKAAA